MHFTAEFCDLVMLLKRTPKLKSLTINPIFDENFIDAYQWEDLITTSIPHLNIFKFKSKCLRKSKNEDIVEKFKQFQSDFWYQQHHWYNEYSLSNDSALIYTIPYITDVYELTSYTKRYLNEILKKINPFDNVVTLVVEPDVITEECDYHFSHVTSLALGRLRTIVDDSLLQLETPLVLREILKQTSQLSSLSINPNILISLFNDDELNNSNAMKQFYTVFSDIEQLKCVIDERHSLLDLLEHLSKLTYLIVFSLTISPNDVSWLKEAVQKQNMSIVADFDDTNSAYLSICITRDIL